MARKKPKSASETPPEATPAEQPVEQTAQPDRHKRPAMSCRPDSYLRALIEAVALAERRKPSQMMVILLEEALQARGKWDPPEDYEP